jgi:hypothetical protein
MEMAHGAIYKGRPDVRAVNYALHVAAASIGADDPRIGVVVLEIL